jgi:pyruvate/2-oxoacid:ferredoxin oxidoreductase alpha subunit
MVGPEAFMEVRYLAHARQLSALERIPQIGEEFAERFGRTTGGLLRTYRCEDAELLFVACNTPSRMVKGAVEELRQKGVKAGLFRPQTLWPFPIDALLPLLPHVERIVVVEASPGQLEDELRLAVSHAGVRLPRIEHVQRYGGVLPQQRDVVTAALTSSVAAFAGAQA